MKILITGPSLDSNHNIGGISTVIKTIMRHNKEQKYYHYLLGRSDKPVNKLKWFLKSFRQFAKFPVFVRKHKIELVHQNLPLDPKGIIRELIIQTWCVWLQVPVVLHVHGGVFITKGTQNKLYRRIILRLFRRATQVLVLSDLEQKILNEQFGCTNSLVLPNSLDVRVYNSIVPKQWNESPRILFLGRIEKNKGIVELVEALKNLPTEIDFKFIVCGKGPLLEYCIEKCSIALGDKFEYRGVVSGKEKIKIIKESAVFVLPSYFEGLPMALLETMADGVVPVVTKVGSMKQIIQHRENGLLVSKQNAEDLSEKLKDILSDRQLFNKLSVNAKNTVIESFSIEKQIIKLNEIYKQSNK